MLHSLREILAKYPVWVAGVLFWLRNAWEQTLELTSSLSFPNASCALPHCPPQSIFDYLFRNVPGLPVSSSEIADQEGPLETTVSTSAVGAESMGQPNPLMPGK